MRHDLGIELITGNRDHWGYHTRVTIEEPKMKMRHLTPKDIVPGNRFVYDDDGEAVFVNHEGDLVWEKGGGPVPVEYALEPKWLPYDELLTFAQCVKAMIEHPMRVYICLDNGRYYRWSGACFQTETSAGWCPGAFGSSDHIYSKFKENDE